MYIRSYKNFFKVCKFIKNKNVDLVGIDTEFVRKYTYYPKLSLIQLIFIYKNKNRIFLFDVEYLKDIVPFLHILKSRKIKKIFFSFSQDLDAFFYYTKYINNVEDIQLMLEFSGYNKNFSYSDAVNNILNINFKKNKMIQSSNWIDRPLTEKQIKYAINDVYFLFSLYNKLIDKLGDNYKYYLNEIKYIIKFKKKEYLINNAWKKSKILLNKKSIDYVLLFKEISKWRENEAISKNKIRSFILSDEAIDIIIKNRVKSIDDFKFLYSKSKILNIKKEYKSKILDIINNFYKNYNNVYNDEIFYTIEKGFIYKKKMIDIYNKIKDISEKNGIFIEKTISKTDIIFLIMKYEKKTSILYGWKRKLFDNIFNK